MALGLDAIGPQRQTIVRLPLKKRARLRPGVETAEV